MWVLTSVNQVWSCENYVSNSFSTLCSLIKFKYWFGLSVSLCLICSVSVWLSNFLGNYFVPILFQFYFIFMLPFLKAISFVYLSVVYGLGGISAFYSCHPRYLFFYFIPCFILNTFLVLQIPLLHTSCQSYSFTITLAFVYLSLVSLRLKCNTCNQNISECLPNTLSKVTRILTIIASKQIVLVNRLIKLLSYGESRWLKSLIITSMPPALSTMKQDSLPKSIPITGGHLPITTKNVPNNAYNSEWDYN
jgi:hypothetical protein